MIVFLLGAQLYLFLSQLLEAISVMSTKDTKKAKGQNSNYQDAATALVDRSHDNKVALQDDDKSDDEEDNDILPGSFPVTCVITSLHLSIRYFITTVLVKF